MTAEETLKYWRDNLSCDDQVKRQLAEEYANARTKKDNMLLDKIFDLIYNIKINDEETN